MTYQIQKGLAASYRLDLLACINKAEKGLLSPSGQEYCFDEIEQLKETAEYPEDGNALFRQLRHNFVHQLSNFRIGSRNYRCVRLRREIAVFLLHRSVYPHGNY